MFSFMQEISESKLIPNKHFLHEYDSEELAELAYINILSLRILLFEKENGTKTFAEQYCKKTIRYGNFKHWHIDSTDIYVMIYGITSDEAKLDKNDHHLRIHMPVDTLLIYKWLRAAADKHLDKNLTDRLFVKLDTMFRIKDSSLRAIRRLVMDWEEIKTFQRRLALTRLLQYMRTKAAKGELLQKLNHVAVLRNLEIDNVDNPETGELKETKFSNILALENASAGSTSAGNVAAVVGGLGAGFDKDYSKSVYPAPIIRRNPITENTPISSYPKILYDAKEIADYIVSIDPDYDKDAIEDEFEDKKAILTLIPAKKINKDDNHHISFDKQKKYEKMNLDTMPPLVIVNGKIWDGNHRFRAGLKNGKTDFWCYVVKNA